ncbi:DUF547 domain-containing protein [Vibrio cincinnatiensis]|uniref:DUF547 domain-containing protein n=1 Tax=Vibrio cincinnatiensis TaxID=675 RepID=UPI001EE03B74|nr:DUF547 domain-containing protein [Vibrio cincinnatiensis]MCG3729893.1 DUF547 domain-containing protein [Vibrio cincinnatiensis]
MKYLISLLALCFSQSPLGAPKPDLWDYWNKSDEHSQMVISHHSWQIMLDNYLIQHDQQTLFAYAQVSQDDQETLQNYLNQLSQFDPRRLNKREQYAYWINLYNALTVKIILENYPLTSITKLGGWFQFGPWDLPLITIQGQDLTLNDIEHRILRPIWQDPKIHYVLNCASLGCPNLQAKVFTAKNIDSQLEEAAQAFINSTKGAQFKESSLILSTIYKWYADDFGNKAQLLQHLSRYRPELSHYTGRIRYEYNWSLNDI